ncbi:MAG TPA: hypothetical protein VM598_13850 [Bdellovibrionota bacterium]|nr:hypothetical protein [Bdellovibrionota bacterium]
MFPVRLESGRIVLREWEEPDWLAAHEYARDPEVVKYETWGPNSSARAGRSSVAAGSA